MQAIHLSGYVSDYSELRVSTVSAPWPTAAAPIHVRIEHAAINYVDLLYSRGLHQNNAAGLVKPPFVLGLEFSGTVIAVPEAADGPDSNPDGLRPGDAVYGACSSGAFASEICVDAAQVRRVPSGVPGWDARGAAGVAATAPVAYGALVRCAKVKAGETVLVHAAAGGLGVMAVQIARALGAKVIAAVGSEAKARYVKEALGVGSSNIVNYSAEGWEKQVLDLTGGKSRGGADVVFDTVGLVEKSMRCTKYGGRVVVAGFAGREGNLEKVAANRILLKGISVIGYRYGEHGRRYPGEHTAIWQGLEDLMQQQSVKPMTHGERFEGLQSVPRAMQALAERRVCGKAVIDVRPAAHGKASL